MHYTYRIHQEGQFIYYRFFLLGREVTLDIAKVCKYSLLFIEDELWILSMIDNAQGVLDNYSRKTTGSYDKLKVAN